jgi:hypothetical protein
MMINIVTSLFPFRLNINSKEPIELTLKIKNMGREEKFISYDVILDKKISLDKSGLKKSDSFRYGKLKPDELITNKLLIYPFQGIKPGDHEILIRVNEHYLDYNSLKQKTEKIITIKSI